jgi:hypothetical protein
MTGGYLICFDFPELDEPVFAGWAGDAPGISPTMAGAMRFELEADAERFLANSYGPNIGEYGTVVEAEGTE